ARLRTDAPGARAAPADRALARARRHRGAGRPLHVGAEHVAAEHRVDPGDGGAGVCNRLGVADPRSAPPPCPDRRCRSGAWSGGLPIAEPVEGRTREDARRCRNRRALMLLADTLLADPAQSPAAVAAGAPLSTGQTPAG